MQDQDTHREDHSSTIADDGLHDAGNEYK